MDFADTEIRELVESDIPVVTIDYVFDNRLEVSSGNVKGIRDFLTYVYEQGHRKIAYIYGHQSAVSRGLRIPEDISIAGYDGINITQ